MKGLNKLTVERQFIDGISCANIADKRSNSWTIYSSTLIGDTSGS